MHFDDILKYLGDFGKYQKIQYALLVVMSVSNAFQTLSNVWYAFIPDDYRCFIPGRDNSTSDPYYMPNLNWSIPVDSENNDRHCKYYEYPVYDEFDKNHTKLTECSKFVYDKSVYEHSAAMEFDLVCSDQIKSSVLQSMYMAGLLVGAIGFGTLSDKIGRKRVLMLTVVLQLIAGICNAFMPEFYSFTVFRFLVAATAMGRFLTTFVIAMELLGGSVRTAAGVGFQIAFSLGYMIMTGLAYWIQDWQTLQIVITVFPGTLFLAYYWLIPESIRWCIINGRHEEALATVKRASVLNSVEIPQTVLEKNTVGDEKVLPTENVATTRQASSVSILHLFKTPKLRCRTINLCFNWFVNSLVYYGLSLGSSNLDGDKYMNFFYMGLAELPGLFLAIYGMTYVGRKWSLSIAMIVGGIACILTYPLDDYITVSIVLSMVGKACIAGSFAIVYNISAEIFPTQLRNNGLGLASMCARIGGISAPLIAQLDRYVSPSGLSLKGFPILFFGGCAFLAGVLALLLPETKGRDLPETIEDAENFDKKNEREKDTQQPSVFTVTGV